MFITSTGQVVFLCSFLHVCSRCLDEYSDGSVIYSNQIFDMFYSEEKSIPYAEAVNRVRSEPFYPVSYLDYIKI